MCCKYWAYRISILLVALFALQSCNNHENESKHQKHKRQFSENPYKKEFDADYDAGINFFIENRELISSTLDSLSVDKAVVLAVVFPETIRYSLIQDFLETSFLETVYVESGAEYADFSIGRFQMKPSFVEMLEQKLKSDSVLSEKYRLISTFPGECTKRQIREIRLQRLKSVEMQLFYAAAFYDVLTRMYPDETLSVEFYASAYNFGFLREKKAISSHILRKSFPFGRKAGQNVFSYSEISSYFYQNHYKSIF